MSVYHDTLPIDSSVGTLRAASVSRVGKLVVLNYEFLAVDAEKTYSWGQMSTIPAGYRPNTSFRIMATCGEEGAVVLASVETGGAIKLRGTVLRRAVVAFTAVYFTP